MRIAFFNWRDIRHPSAGGAEMLVHQLNQRLVKKGHYVTLFTSLYPGSAKEEIIDGVVHVRYGGRYSIYLKARQVYKSRIEGKFDIIVESINGFPFFTPLFAKERLFPFIHQLTKENWYSGLPSPIAFICFHTEGMILSFYKDNSVLVPSESTKAELESIGLRHITVIHPGTDIDAPLGIEKETHPTLIFLGRLAKSKRVDHAMLAFKRVREKFKSARLWIVGFGPEEKRLKVLSHSIGISDSIEFFGKVDERKKLELLSKAHLALFPAVREGWGLVVLESNLCGTPVIGYDVPGLRDSIMHGKNGFLVPSGDIEGMADKAITLLNHPKSYLKISIMSRKYAQKFRWDDFAEKFESSLMGCAR